MQDHMAYEQEPGRKSATTSLILGIAGIVTAPLPFIPVILGVGAVSLGSATHKLDDRLDVNVERPLKIRATVGIVLGCIAFLLGSVSTFWFAIIMMLSGRPG